MTPATDGQALELSVECRTSRKASRGRRHPVLIHTDWTVETPHDLDAERVAAAFGGYTSCLELVDQVIPAIAQSMGFLTRREHIDLHRSEDGTAWDVPVARGCRCTRAKFPTAQAAAAHLRSVEHISHQHKTSARRLGEVLEAVRQASQLDLLDLPALTSSARAFVLEESGVRDLWQAGIHPADIPVMAAHVAVVDQPLPVNFYLGLTYGEADVEWLARTIASRPDPHVATWLAWTPAQSGLHSEDVGAWLELGLARRQIEVLIAAGVGPQTAYDVSAATDRTPHAAAGDLATWAAAGCHIGVAHLKLLDRHGLGSSFQPSRSAIDRLVASAERVIGPPDRTELGVLLALEGTCRNVEAVLAAGIRRADELVARSQGGADLR